MAHEQDGEQPPARAETAVCGSHDLLASVAAGGKPRGSESLTTVLVAFGANLLVAVAKSIAG